MPAGGCGSNVMDDTITSFCSSAVPRLHDEPLPPASSIRTDSRFEFEDEDGEAGASSQGSDRYGAGFAMATEHVVDMRDMMNSSGLDCPWTQSPNLTSQGGGAAGLSTQWPFCRQGTSPDGLTSAQGGAVSPASAIDPGIDLEQLLQAVLLHEGLLEDHATDPQDGHITGLVGRSVSSTTTLREMRRSGPLGELSEEAQTTLLGGTLYEYSDMARPMSPTLLSTRRGLDAASLGVALASPSRRSTQGDRRCFGSAESADVSARLRGRQPGEATRSTDFSARGSSEALTALRGGAGEATQGEDVEDGASSRSTSPALALAAAAGAGQQALADLLRNSLDRILRNSAQHGGAGGGELSTISSSCAGFEEFLDTARSVRTVSSSMLLPPSPQSGTSYQAVLGDGVLSGVAGQALPARGSPLVGISSAAGRARGVAAEMAADAQLPPNSTEEQEQEEEGEAHLRALLPRTPSPSRGGSEPAIRESPPVVVASPSHSFGGALGSDSLQVFEPRPRTVSETDDDDENVVSVIGFDSPHSISVHSSVPSTGRRDRDGTVVETVLDETASLWGFGDTVRSATSTVRSESVQQSARTVLGETLTLEGGLDGGLTSVLHRLALENLQLDESLTRSVRRVLQLGTVLTGQRLSDDEINSLPKVRFEQGEQQNCAICLEAYQRGELLTALRCDHFFHVDCLARWFRRATQCPLCRATCGNGEAAAAGSVAGSGMQV